jgi:uncharacterized protein involved in outer membrane biogenesis
MTLARKVLLWCLAIFLAVVAIVLVVVATFDWNRVKPVINDKVSEQLGRPFAINGNLAVLWSRAPEETGWRSWLPWPRFVAEDITLGNTDWAKAPQMVSLQKVEFRLAPLPLLWRSVTIPRIDLTQPTASLERLADGRNNWTFTLKPSDPNEPPSESPWVVDIGAIGFDKGQVKVDDQSLKTQIELLIDPLGKPVPFAEIVGKPKAEQTAEQGATPQDYAFGWKLKGQYKGQALSGNGKVGGLLALQDSRQPFPVQASVQIGTTKVSLAGTLTDPKNFGALDLRLQLAGTSLGNLYPLTGVTLPDTPAYATDGHLRAQLRDPAGMQFHYEQFNGSIGDSDIHGDLSYIAGQPRPKLSGTLTSNQVRFADLAPLIGADSKAEQKARGVTSKQPSNKVLPVEEFRTERWRDMDADVTFTGKRIVHSEKLPFNDLNAHVLLDDGKLSLDPLRFGVAGGQLTSTIRLDGSRTPMQGRAQLSARNFKLKELFPTFAPLQTSFGALHGDVDLSGTGNSVAALLGTSNGDVRMLINDGAVSRELMELAGLNVGNYVVGKLFGDKDVRINCAAADMGVKDGVLTTRMVVFDTENALIHVDGTANFKTEQLDMTIDPQSKGVRIISLRSPLYVRGTFKKPDAGVKTVPLLARGAGMLALGAIVAPVAGLVALVAPSGGGDQVNECAPLLAKMKAGKL